MSNLITLSEELDAILKQHGAHIQPIGPYALQNWIDWLIMQTQRGVSKQNVLEAIENYEKNWNW